MAPAGWAAERVRGPNGRLRRHNRFALKHAEQTAAEPGHPPSESATTDGRYLAATLDTANACSEASGGLWIATYTSKRFYV